MGTRKMTSIKYRILRLSLISIITAVVSLCTTMGIATVVIGKSGYANEIKSLANAYTANIETMSSVLRMEVREAAENEILLEYDFSEATLAATKAEMAKLCENTHFTDLNIADTNGKTTNDTDVSSHEFFNKAKSGATYIEGPFHRATDGSVVFMVGTLMDNGYVMYGTFEYNVLSTGLDASPLGEGGVIMLLNKKGEVMASSDDALIKEVTNFTDPEYANQAKGKIARDVLSGKSGSEELTGTYGRMAAYYEPIENTDGWGICVMGNLANTTKEIATTCVIGVILGLAILVVGTYISRNVAKKIATAVATTSDRLALLAKGDLKSPVQVFKTNDETQVLSESLSFVCTELGRYVSNIEKTAGEMAQGDFSYSERFDYLGDFENIAQSFSDINRVLGSVIADMSSASSDVSCGAQQIADGTSLLAEGTTKQATAVDELTATIEDINKQINNSADAAAEAARLSASSASTVEEQAEDLKALLAAIKDISEKSEQISSVIRTIEDIAFQTNILALNASIEAARAGEAGKGFAVVAGEVGNLASKSAEAAKGTAELIEASLAAVKDGTVKAEATAEKMTAVQEISKQVDELIESIASAARNQAVAADQITVGIQQIAEVVQQNSATAEETAASCEELSGQSKTLADLVSGLKA